MNRAGEKAGPRAPLTYAQAGVDIDAGNAMVEKIKPLVRATRRSGAAAEIGGFGAPGVNIAPKRHLMI